MDILLSGLRYYRLAAALIITIDCLEDFMLDLSLPQPYLLFLGDTMNARDAKTAFGLRDWARERCMGEYALPAATVTTGLPRLTPACPGIRFPTDGWPRAWPIFPNI